MNATKAELEQELRTLKNQNKALTEKVEKLKSKVEASKYERILFLFRVDAMSEIYANELKNKTTLIKTVDNVYGDDYLTIEKRRFADGNYVMITYRLNAKTNKLEFESADFYRRLGDK